MRSRSIRPLRDLVLAVAATLASAATAQDAFPAHPIRFVVPYLAGGTTDLVARVVGEKMSQILGQPVVVENRGGAGGNIGMSVVARAPADGYTIGFGAISTNALNPHIYKDLGFDPRKDFTAVGLLGYSTIVVEVGRATADPRHPRTDRVREAACRAGLRHGRRRHVDEPRRAPSSRRRPTRNSCTSRIAAARRASTT